jgi:hypothetical protein
MRFPTNCSIRSNHCGLINGKYRCSSLNVFPYKLFNPFKPLWFDKWKGQMQQFECVSVQDVQSIYTIVI